MQEPAENKIVDKPQEISYNDSNKENGYVGFEDAKPKSQNSKSLNGMSFLEASKNDSFLENRYKFGPQFNEWLKKNHDAIKYSGDNTFNNIKNTMENDVPRFMKDAPFNVDKNGLISSLVKWNLADKAGNKDLKDKAVKNTIGYMSEENQEEYLKDQQPLEDYVKASDDYDHQRGNFKTTEYSTSEPDEDVMKIQNLLVDLDYRNKYDEPIKVDGLVGSDTLYSAENLNKDTVEPIVEQMPDLTPTTESALARALQRYRDRGQLPVRTGERPETTTSNNGKNPQETQKIQNNTYINDNGIEKWRELPYVAQRLPIETQLFRQGKLSSKVYNAFDILSQEWFYADTLKRRNEVELLTQEIRDNNYNEQYCEMVINKLYNSDSIIKAGYADGVWYKDHDSYEFGKDSDTYKILADLDSRFISSDNTQRQQLEKAANEARRLSREGTPLLYGQNIIMELLHNNVLLSNEYKKSYFDLVQKTPNVMPPYFWFVQMTCSDWDYKRNSNWQVPYGKFNNLNMETENRKNWTPWIYFDGMFISADKLGNINLGYVGTKMGFEGIMIKNFYTMDKDDGFYVEYGIKMAEQGR